MAIQGLRHTSNFVVDERPKHWRAGLHMQKPNGMAPLTGLSTVMKTRKVDDPQFHWWEKSVQTRRLQLSGDLGAAGTDTDLTVSADAFSVKAGDVLKVEHTNEILLVSATPTSDTTVNVTREFAGTTGATVTVASENPFVTVIGSAYEENSDAPDAVMFDPTKVFNYTQIFRTTLAASRTAMKTRLRTKPAVEEAKREAMEIHGIDMERAFWFGEKSEGVGPSGNPRRTTAGVLSFIDAANIVDASGATQDMNWLEERLHDAFLYGSSEKMGWCANRSLLTINQIIRKNSSFEIRTGLKEYGMNVQRLICPYGEVVLKTHPLWNQMTPLGAYKTMNSSLVLLDMDELTYVPFQDDDTRYERDLQNNGQDGVKSGFITEAGIEMHHPRSHMYISGLDTPAKDT